MDNVAIHDDEFLYRRVPGGQVDEGRPGLDAFKPDKHATDGMSMFRARFLTKEQIAPRAGRNPYYVATFRARELRKMGLDLQVSPTEEHGDAHLVIPQLTTARRNDPLIEEFASRLRDAACEFSGPYSHHLKRD